MAEAAGAATGGVGSDRTSSWQEWFERGRDYIDDIDDWMGRMSDGRDATRYGPMVRDGMAAMRGHMRSYSRDWDGWDNRYAPVFEDWTRRMDAMHGRWDGRDWSRDWRSHAAPYGQMRTDFNTFRDHYNRMYTDWGQRYGWN